MNALGSTSDRVLVLQVLADTRMHAMGAGVRESHRRQIAGTIGNRHKQNRVKQNRSTAVMGWGWSVNKHLAAAISQGLRLAPNPAFLLNQDVFLC